MSLFRRRLLTISNSGNAVLPAEYQQVEYIQSSGAGSNSGGQYIDTGIRNAGFVLEMDLTILGNTNSERSCCGTYGGGTSFLCNWNSGGFFNYGNSRNEWTPSNFSIGNTYHVVGTNTTSTSTTLIRPPWLFSQNEGQSYGYHSSSIQMRHCVFYWENTLIRDFYPCYRKSDNKPGLYDIVNDVFYTNGSNGVDFTIGPNYEGIL